MPDTPAKGKLIKKKERGILVLLMQLHIGIILRTQEAACKHGDECKGNHARNKHSHANRHSEFPEKAPHDPPHEKQRYENRRQGECHGNDCEDYLFGAVKCGGKPVLAHFHVAENVLEHDYRIVHDEAYGKRQRHQGQVVEAVAEDINKDEGSNKGHRKRKRRNYRGAETPEKEEYH